MSPRETELLAAARSVYQPGMRYIDGAIARLGRAIAAYDTPEDAEACRIAHEQAVLGNRMTEASIGEDAAPGDQEAKSRAKARQAERRMRTLTAADFLKAAEMLEGNAAEKRNQSAELARRYGSDVEDVKWSARTLVSVATVLRLIGEAPEEAVFARPGAVAAAGHGEEAAS